MLVLRDVEVEGRRVDVTCAGGLVASLGPAGTAPVAEHTVAGDGGALLPGLHDHHIHLLGTAAAATSVDCSSLPDRAALGRALSAADVGRWVRAVGYHESQAGPLDRWVLDDLVGDRPVRVQHAGGALWVLSSAAVRAARLDEAGPIDGLERDARGEPTGRLWRLDEWLRQRIPASPPDLAGLGRRLAALGVTGVTDTTPTEDPGSLELLAQAARSGALPQRIQVTGSPALAVADIPPPLAVGPAKILLPDHELPPLERIVELVRAARRSARAVAVHCVTAESLVLTMAALDAVGSPPVEPGEPGEPGKPGKRGDRIEHGALVLPGLLPQLAALGVTVVTQPAMVQARGDRYLAEVDPAELPYLWPCRSLLDAGIPTAAGTDAPYGPLDPWAAVATAATRRTAGGATLGEGERIDAARALAMFLGPLDAPGGSPRRVALGAPADLCLLDRPLATALAEPSADHVALTVIGGQVAFSA
jgi:predicted amidohydrolase YtcJ